MATPPAHSGDQLAARIRAALADAGDPARAEAQRRYMKSALPYRGLTSPELRTLLRPLLASYEPDSRAEWESTVRDLWDGATHREEWYAALAVARHRRARAWLDPGSLPLWRHLVTTGAWWDVVDETATHLVRDTLAGHAEPVTPVIDAWSVDDDVWLRRTSVLCQVGRGPDTDVALLRRVVEANVEDPSFWLRKAVGWALRDYARTDPAWSGPRSTGSGTGCPACRGGRRPSTERRAHRAPEPSSWAGRAAARGPRVGRMRGRHR